MTIKNDAKFGKELFCQEIYNGGFWDKNHAKTSREYNTINYG